MLKLIPDQTKFDFMRWHKLAIAISAIGMILTVVLLFTEGLNLGTDFAGGVLMEVQTPKAKNLSGLRADLDTLDLGHINLQQLGNEDQVLIRLGQQKGEDGLQRAIQAVKDKIGEGAEYRRVEFVGPQVGNELIKKGIWAVILSSVGILGFVMFRFRWEFGLCSVIALLHDALLTIGLFTITRAEFDLSTLAAVLMIGGYSINDTVVVFDRVREMMRKYRKMPLPELFNLSINATLSRTVLTGGTAILALLALWFLGGAVIRGFVGALIWGIVVGTYSSVFVATPMLLYLGLKEEHKQRLGLSDIKV
ncbi:MAG: protein-export rane protein SecF [Alphaproteobacteria bacterium]|nr:protein-export rane protein SecF [Alphaproteobacteria bacterium]